MEILVNVEGGNDRSFLFGGHNHVDTPQSATLAAAIAETWAALVDGADSAVDTTITIKLTHPLRRYTARRAKPELVVEG